MAVAFFLSKEPSQSKESIHQSCLYVVAMKNSENPHHRTTAGCDNNAGERRLLQYVLECGAAGQPGHPDEQHRPADKQSLLRVGYHPVNAETVSSSLKKKKTAEGTRITSRVVESSSRYLDSTLFYPANNHVRVVLLRRS